MSQSLSRLTWVSGRQGLALCRRLARVLDERLDRSTLAESAFLAIPRGGHIVLGWLSYLLDLRREQLMPEAVRAAKRVVVVDDAAFSGHRFGQFISGLAAEEIVFAHLLSPDSLRRALLGAEPRVKHCIAARDVRELSAPELPPLAERLRHLPPPRYWAGPTEMIAFPWGEPDGVTWDPDTGEPVRAFRLVPPEKCLGNHIQPGVTVVEVEEPTGDGPLRPSAQALWLLTPERSLLADRTTCEVLELEGAAATIWRSLLRTGDAARILADLRTEYDAPEATLRADLERFLAELTARGLIVTEAGRGD